MTNLGVGLDCNVICYDQQEGNWATRAAFILTAYGHKNVMILDGGMKKWLTEGLQTESD